MEFKYQGLGTYKRDKVGRFSSLKAKLHRVWILFKRLVIASVVVFGAGAFGATFYSTSTVTATTQTVTVTPEAPVLDRIADCESGNGHGGTATHYDKNGQVLMRPNKNGTVDVGKYQINSVWFAQATTLELDMTKEADNRKMAEWIYANKGTEPWYSSAHCWMK